VADQLIFNALLEIHKDFKKHMKDFRIKRSIDAIRAEHLKTEAYKQLQAIPPSQTELYESLRCA